MAEHAALASSAPDTPGSGLSDCLPAGNPATRPSLLEIRNVSRSFNRSGGLLGEAGSFWAVSEVSLKLERGETLGLVGESGSGKSTLARMAVRLLEPSRGEILLDGRSVFDPDKTFQAGLPGRLQMVFQDPYSSLNPRLRVGSSIGEALACAGMGKTERKERVAWLLEQVGLEADYARRFPHEFSGGQRQRMALARALALEPDLIVCDEPVSSLDASVQAQVLNLLKEHQERLGLTYLFISHDLAVVAHMSDRVAVMYAGMLVELGTTGDLFANPMHPYTLALLAASGGAGKADAAQYPALPTQPDLPDVSNLPGLPDLSHLPDLPLRLCPYRRHCRAVLPQCAGERPPFSEIAPGHFVRCLRYNQL